MKSKMKCYNEKYFYTSAMVPNADELKNRKVCEEKGTSLIFNRTGIIMVKGIIYVVFPCGYRIGDLYYDIELLLNLFNRLANEKKMDKEYYDLIELEYEGNGQLLAVASEIIKDYRENGYIKIENVVHGLNIGGKVNWKKTMKLKKQILTEDGIPIFTDLVMTRNENDKDALLRSLHMYVINKSIAMFGVLWGIGSECDEDAVHLPIDKEYAIKFLQSEMHVTYNSRLLRVIELIIKFIDSDEKESTNDTFMSLSTQSFYSVWELMCKVILSDEFPSMQEKIPKPYWKIKDGDTRYSEQIPDIVYIENKDLYVLDAKYYNIKKNLPGWHDLVKQYFYEISLRTILKEVTTSYNIMLMPADIPMTARLWGISAVENVPQFREIKGILLNTKKVVENYCYGSRENYRNAVKNVLNKNEEECRENVGSNLYLTL